MNENVAQFMFLSVVVASALSFVAVIVWVSTRHKEREAYYRSEMIKKVAESGTSNAVVEFLRETERISAQRTRAGLKLGGLIVVAAGIGMMVFLSAISRDKPVYLAGLVPFAIGVAMLFYAQFLAPRD